MSDEVTEMNGLFCEGITYDEADEDCAFGLCDADEILYVNKDDWVTADTEAEQLTERGMEGGIAQCRLSYDDNELEKTPYCCQILDADAFEATVGFMADSKSTVEIADALESENYTYGAELFNNAKMVAASVASAVATAAVFQI